MGPGRHGRRGAWHLSLLRVLDPLSDTLRASGAAGSLPCAHLAHTWPLLRASQKTGRGGDHVGAICFATDGGTYDVVLCQ